MALSRQSKFLLKASFAGTFAETMLVPFWAFLTNRVGGSILDAGIGFAIFSLITGIAVVTIGQTKWYERNVNWMVFWGFLVGGAGDFIYILVRNKYQLFANQALIGLAVGFLNPAWDTLFTENKDESSSKKWSFWNGGINFITGVSALAGGFVVAKYGFNTLFITMGVIDALAIYYAYRSATS